MLILPAKLQGFSNKDFYKEMSIQTKDILENNSILDTWAGEKPSFPYKALMGYAGVIIKDNEIDLLDMLHSFIEKGAEESCGQCFPCRNGLKKIAKRLKALCCGESCEDDLAFLSQQAKIISASVRCDIGKTSVKPLLDIIEKAPQLLKAHAVKKNNYTSMITAPCMNACPAHVNIPNYLEKIRIAAFNDGLESVMESCIMPGTIGRVCTKPCESACTRALNGEALSIRNLKRFLFDNSFKENKNKEVKKKGKNNKIAIVGAGPAGLSCAYFLALQGYKVSIFEKEEKAGGMAKYGIPIYRLPDEVLEAEVQKIQYFGVEIHYNTEIGKKLKIKDLEENGFKAIFIAAGSQKAPSLRCEGEKECKSGLVSGIEYLHKASENIKIVEGKKALVVGGGNVAMDCVRTLLRHGFEKVSLIYRRTEQEMPADKMEIHEAKLEGVEFIFLAAPQKIIEENGKVKGLYCQKMTLGEPDSSGRRSPIPLENKVFYLDCDVIVPAIGQNTDIAYLFDELEHEGDFLDKYKNLNADEISGKAFAKTKNLYLFGGGDCHTGAKTLISALAEGKRSAKYIAQVLEKNEVLIDDEARLEFELNKINILDNSEKIPADFKEAVQPPMLDIDKRLQGFEEVEKSFSMPSAKLEASRCLRCFRIVMLAN